MRVNGEERKLAGPTNLNALLSEMDIDAARVVVERNGVIVAREGYAATALSDDDVLEILHFIGGG